MTSNINTYIKVYQDEELPTFTDNYVVQVQISRLTYQRSQNIKHALIDLFDDGFITDNVEVFHD